MKADKGYKVKTISEICYGSVFGLVKIAEGKILTVKHRNNDNDGIIAVETIFVNGQLGEKELPIEILDSQYDILADTNTTKSIDSMSDIDIDIDFNTAREELINKVKSIYNK